MTEARDSEANPGMARGFYWLSPPTPGRGGLAGMPSPTEAHLERLPDLGIGLVVSLLEGYHDSPPLPAGLRRVRLPITDGAAPADEHFSLVVRLCAFIHHFRRQARAGTGVAVHCLHGRGRTGLLLACYRAYVAARWPGDPDGHPPTSTLPEVNRLLEAAHGVPIFALGLEQTRWTAHFFQRVKREIAPRWEEGMVEELGWQRAGPATEWPVPGLQWECADCGAAARHEAPIGDAPFWCPGCGWATGFGIDG